MDGGAYKPEARSWSNAVLRAVDGRQDMVAVFTGVGWGGLPVIGELTSGGLISYQGNQ